MATSVVSRAGSKGSHLAEDALLHGLRAVRAPLEANVAGLAARAGDRAGGEPAHFAALHGGPGAVAVLRELARLAAAPLRPSAPPASPCETAPEAPSSESEPAAPEPEQPPSLEPAATRRPVEVSFRLPPRGEWTQQLAGRALDPLAVNRLDDALESILEDVACEVSGDAHDEVFAQFRD